ncbi:MAG: hypothetical protein L0Y72_22945 [Gemmataceae bacterium]|nr:hypothetical protein [Gemmataceae bacterium]MCI0741901.1 hypothetical protein [Gemmataceae bacterium]
MTSPEPSDFVQDALDSGRIDEGRACLDAWQASQPTNLDTLSQLRYYRRLLGQHHEAIEVAKAMIRLRPHDAWERMSDQLSLGELCVAVGALDNAWGALSVVFEWPELRDWYSAGMGRSTVELALDICAAATADRPASLARRASVELAEKAFDTAVRLLDDGCSTSFVLLEKARDCSKRLERGELFERFQHAAAAEWERIQRQVKGPSRGPPGPEVS